MQENMLLLDIPEFHVVYQEEDYSYTKEKGKENLQKILYEASHNYCMYCYTRIKSDNRGWGHLEHAIEKNICQKRLINCIPNIGITCSVCNNRYKKAGERKRYPEKDIVLRFSQNECTVNCKDTCLDYQLLKNSYLKKKEAHIILQPEGVVGEDTGEKLLLQYDVLEAKFIPNTSVEYSMKEIQFIEDHIERFRLNAKEEKSRQLIRFVEDTIEKEGNYTKIDYNNMIVELFVTQVLKNRSQKEILKLCKLIYTISCVKFNT